MGYNLINIDNLYTPKDVGKLKEYDFFHLPNLNDNEPIICIVHMNDEKTKTIQYYETNTAQYLTDSMTIFYDHIMLLSDELQNFYKKSFNKIEESENIFMYELAQKRKLDMICG